jgi:NADPH:quinone reductase-like Zn-dependent oxidoreductase
MRVAAIHDGRLVTEERPDPVPKDGELLVRIHAAGVNGADLGQRAGWYPPPAGVTDVPGLECAGETEDGRRVMALLPGGGHGELVAVDERHVLDVPDGWDWPAAGGFVEVFATAHDALFTQAELKSGERLLINGAAGGVGVAAVQLALAAGATVTANARHHHDELRALGADTEIDGEYDVILELVGGENLASNLEKLALKGRISIIGTGAGSKAEIEFRYLMAKRGRILASHLRNRSGEEKAEVMRLLGETLAANDFTVPVHETFPLEQAQEAYEAFARGGKYGKLVICP